VKKISCHARERIPAPLFDSLVQRLYDLVVASSR
jgi:hypothetical protein